VKSTQPPDYFLDISQEVCPLTLVRAKLFLEALGPGIHAVIRLPDGEPRENLPRMLTELGHDVLGLKRESPIIEGQPPVFRMDLMTKP